MKKEIWWCLIGLIVLMPFVNAETFELGVYLNGTNLTIAGYGSNKTYNISGNFNDTFVFSYDLNFTCASMFENLTACWKKYDACSLSEAQCQGFKMFWTDQFNYKDNYTNCVEVELPRCNDRVNDANRIASEVNEKYLNLNRTYTTTLQKLDEEKGKHFPYAVLAGVLTGGLVYVVFWRRKKSDSNVRGPPQTTEYSRRI